MSVYEIRPLYPLLSLGVLFRKYQADTPWLFVMITQISHIICCVHTIVWLARCFFPPECVLSLRASFGFHAGIA